VPSLHGNLIRNSPAGRKETNQPTATSKYGAEWTDERSRFRFTTELSEGNIASAFQKEMVAHPTESRWRRSAPQERSCRTQSRLPPRAAKCSGVLPGNLQERALESNT
jgi:hypothetical protein